MPGTLPNDHMRAPRSERTRVASGPPARLHSPPGRFRLVDVLSQPPDPLPAGPTAALTGDPGNGFGKASAEHLVESEATTDVHDDLSDGEGASAFEEAAADEGAHRRPFRGWASARESREPRPS